jgi:hypothetical protein
VHRAPRLPGFLLFAIVVVAVLFSDALLTGRVLSQADILFEHAPWSAHAPRDFVRPGNDLLSDIPQVFYPFLIHTARSLRAGALPLWNAAIFAGHPYLASYQSATFSPFTLPVLFVPPTEALLAAAIAKLLAGALGMWLFLRRLGLGPAALWFGATAYLLCPFNVVWIEHPVSAVSAWLPLFLWSADRLLTSSALRDVALLSLLVGAVILAGHPETSYKVLLFGGAYVLAGVWRSSAPDGARPAEGWRAGLRMLATRFAPAAVIGLLIASIQVVPFGEYLSRSYIWEMRREAPANVYPAPLATAVTAVVPNFFGNPSHGNYLRLANRHGWLSNFCEQQIYPGIVTWVLATMGLAACRRTWRARFFAITAVVGALVMFGTPGIADALLTLPGASVIIVTRFGLLTVTSAIVLASYGVDALSRATGPGQSRLLRPAIWATLAMMAGVAGALAWGLPLLAANGLLAWTLGWCALAVLLIAASITGVWSRATGRMRASQFAVTVLALLTIDLFIVGWRFHPTIPRDRLFPVVPEIALVKADPALFRVAGVSSALLPNTAMIYGLQDVRGYDGMMPAVHGDVLGPVHKGGAYRIVRATDPLHLLDLMNVKYVFAPGGVELPASHFTRVHSTLGSTLFRNERVFPRAFLVDRVRVVSPAESLRLMRGPLVDLRREALLHEPLPEADRPDEARASTGTATVTRYEDAFVEIETMAEGRRLLVLSDLDYPGWHATLDGGPARIVRANRGLRAVAVPPGRHRVVFRFAPWSVRCGAWLTLAGAAAAAGLAWFGRARQAHVA